MFTLKHKEVDGTETTVEFDEVSMPEIADKIGYFLLAVGFVPSSVAKYIEFAEGSYNEEEN